MIETFRSLSQVEQALARYWKITIQTTGKGLAVDRMQRLMDYIGNPEKRLRVIHIAGTSGKTSTAYFTADLLVKAGRRVGLTVSPHIVSLLERVQIDGKTLNEKDFCSQMTEYYHLIKTAPIEPSWHEFMMGFALFVFDRLKVDYAVVETGLGGWHDSSNVCQRSDKLCVITDIDIDHQHILGDSLKAIAVQKAGIIHDGNQVLMYEQSDEVMQAVRFKVSQTEGSDLFVQQQDRLEKALKVNFKGSVPLFQRRNWLLAYCAVRFLATRDEFSIAKASSILKTVKLEVLARMDRRQIGDTTIVLDGAHNPAKMRAFVDSFRDLFPEKKVPVLLALNITKDTKQVASIVSEVASMVILTSASSSGAHGKSGFISDVSKLGLSSQTPTEYIEDPKAALARILQTKQKLVVATGSLYLVGELIDSL